MFLPLKTFTVRTSWYHTYIEKYAYIIATLVYEPYLQDLIYCCALANPHT